MLPIGRGVIQLKQKHTNVDIDRIYQFIGLPKSIVLSFRLDVDNLKQFLNGKEVFVDIKGITVKIQRTDIE